MNFEIKSKKKQAKLSGVIDFIYKGKRYNKKYKSGDDAFYIKLDDSKGLKVISPKPDVCIEEMLANLLQIKDHNYNFFPEIFNVEIDGKFILLELEHIEKKDSKFNFNFSWLPKKDQDFLKDNYTAGCDLNELTKLNYSILKSGLNPEDEWFKMDRNIINDKIVDFHTFSYSTPRYEMETKLSQEELDQIYNNALKRYRDMGVNKWKGVIYEGYRFKGQKPFKGYSSDGQEYDSYRKLNFMYLNKCKYGTGKVLDIGCNEGFLSVQASLHGAKSVTGIDRCEQDIELAKDMVNKVLDLKNVNFKTGDAVKFVQDNKEQYQMVILSSVLHQIYPDMKGSESFLKNISKHTKYMAFETPVNHKLMKISLSAISKNLSKHFKSTRLVYLYDAYSSGYRAIFICCNL